MLALTHDEYDDLSEPLQHAVDAMIVRAVADKGMVSTITADGDEICACPKVSGGTAWWINAKRLSYCNYKRGIR